MTKNRHYPTYFLFGTLLLYVVLYLLPGILGIGYSFTDWTAYSDQVHFLGYDHMFDNYVKAFSDAKYFGYLGNTVLFTLVTTIVKNGVGLALAVGTLVDQVLDHHPLDQVGPGRLRLPGEPAVELRAVDDERVVERRLRPRLGAEVQRDMLLSAQEDQCAARHGSLDRRLFEKVGDELVKCGSVEEPADVLGAAVLAALDDDHLQPGLRHGIGGRQARRPAAHHDRIHLYDVIRTHRHPAWPAGCRSRPKKGGIKSRFEGL